MTKQELSQLYYINREIQHLQTQIAELESAATSGVARITGMPHGTGVADKIANAAAELADLKGLLEANCRRLFHEYNRLNRYIQDIDDAEVRMIMTYRYINGLRWEQVAASISMYATPQSVQQVIKRFLDRQSDG